MDDMVELRILERIIEEQQKGLLGEHHIGDRDTSVTLGKLINTSEPQFPHLQSGEEENLFHLWHKYSDTCEEQCVSYL